MNYVKSLATFMGYFPKDLTIPLKDGILCLKNVYILILVAKPDFK
jgi:hypothetical protein